MSLQHPKSPRTQTSFFVALLFFAAVCAFAMAPRSQGTDRIASLTGEVAPPSAQILFCDAPGTSCSPATGYSIAKLRDLNIVVHWTNLPAGNHTESLAINHGSGLFQSFHKGFIVKESGGSFSSSSALPVAGTWIARRSLTGTWTAQASLDGHLVATQTVTLTP